MLYCRVTCIGEAPILFSRLGTEFVFKPKRNEKHSFPFTKGDVASVHLYRDDQGRIGLPTAHLIHRLNTVIQNQTRFADHFMIHEPFITLLDPDTDQPVGWSTFEAPGRIVDGVQRWILRAKVDRWKCTVLVATEDDRATSLLRKIFVRVGKKRRLGWQPVGDKTFGSFRVAPIEKTIVPEVATHATS